MPKHIKIDISMYNLHNMKVSSDKSQYWARSNEKNAKNRVFLGFPRIKPEGKRFFVIKNRFFDFLA